MSLSTLCLNKSKLECVSLNVINCTPCDRIRHMTRVGALCAVVCTVVVVVVGCTMIIHLFIWQSYARQLRECVVLSTEQNTSRLCSHALQSSQKANTRAQNHALAACCCCCCVSDVAYDILHYTETNKSHRTKSLNVYTIQTPSCMFAQLIQVE